MIATVLSVKIPIGASAQQVTEEWVAIYNGPGNSLDKGWDIALGPSGDVYVTGTSTSNEGGADYTTIAYDSSGNERWLARYDGPANGGDEAYSIAVGPSGNVYVTGFSYGNGAAHDFATVAYDFSGNELWVQRFENPVNTYGGGYVIAVGPSENVYVTGWGEGNLTDRDYITIAYDSLGNELWVQRYDGIGLSKDEPRAMTVDPFGNVIVTGMSCNIWKIYNCDYATVVYDSSGNEMWVGRYTTEGRNYDSASAVTSDTMGNVYVTGWSNGIGISDYATIAYDSSGNELWVARYNGPMNGQDKANDIAVDSSGNVYVTGVGSFGQPTWYDYATIAYDSSGNELWVASYDGGAGESDWAMAMTLDMYGNIFVTGWCTGVENNVTSWNYATVAYDSLGNELWSTTYDGPAQKDDIGKAIAVDTWGNVYVTGYSYNDANHYDFVTLKYSQKWTPKVEIDIDPDTLNLKSRGRWLTAYLELSGGKDAIAIDVSTLLLNGTIPAERWPTSIGDYDEDGIPDLMVKFNRSRVQEYIEGLDISPGGAGIFGYYVTLTVTGSFNDGTTFECSDTIRVLTVERMGVEPSPFSVAEYEGSMKGGLVAVQPKMSLPLSSHSSERLVMVVSDMDCHELPTRRTQHDALKTRE